jgi:hypothetical protein
VKQQKALSRVETFATSTSISIGNHQWGTPEFESVDRKRESCKQRAFDIRAITDRLSFPFPSLTWRHGILQSKLRQAITGVQPDSAQRLIGNARRDIDFNVGVVRTDRLPAFAAFVLL